MKFLNNKETAQQKQSSPVFTDDFTVQYELAIQQGDKRFGSLCKHKRVVSGMCQQCFRKVVG